LPGKLLAELLALVTERSAVLDPDEPVVKVI